MNENDLIARILPTDFWLANVAATDGTEPIQGSSDDEEVRRQYLLELAEKAKYQLEVKESRRRRLRRMQSQRAVQRMVTSVMEYLHLGNAA